MHYIDAHCHLADPRFDGCLSEVLGRARAAGIDRFLQGGVDPADWERQETLKEEGCLPCFGLHPWFVNQAPHSEIESALELLRASLPRAYALGELGLDFGKRMDAQRFELQRDLFRQQLQIAKVQEMPIVLHLVACHGEAPQILRKVAPQWRGLVHGFTGSWEVAQQYLDLGLSLSVGGAVARNGYKKLKNGLKRIPNGRLVVESDAPDMAPATYPRPLNEPDSMHLVAQAVGALRDQSAETVLQQSAENLCHIFHLEARP